MRNKLAEQVLYKDMLFVMKSYQATLDDPERLSSTVCLMENTSVLVDVFKDKSANLQIDGYNSCAKC